MPIDPCVTTVRHPQLPQPRQLTHSPSAADQDSRERGGTGTGIILAKVVQGDTQDKSGERRTHTAVISSDGEERTGAGKRTCGKRAMEVDQEQASWSRLGTAYIFSLPPLPFCHWLTLEPITDDLSTCILFLNTNTATNCSGANKIALQSLPSLLSSASP
ncbi:hypothetical protein E2C01_050380 [Portunus trituberculatus]|uniref:Uncharacterized protein n=1 Tax=Portunus trituberculatus TaxID=210409 RepID=A0A5B7GFY9_PORTR|nr:hypothetical protein [Portunus trituberculatus]